MTYLPDGNTLVTRADEPNLRLWDWKTGEQRAPLPLEDGAWSMNVSPDGRSVAVGLNTGAVEVWDIDPPRGRRLRHHALGPGQVPAVVFSPEGRHLLTANPDGTASVYRLSPPNR